MASDQEYGCWKMVTREHWRGMFAKIAKTVVECDGNNVLAAIDVSWNVPQWHHTYPGIREALHLRRKHLR